jgi:hypothetical protein
MNKKMKRGKATIVCLATMMLYLSFTMTAIQASITLLNVAFNTSKGGPEVVDFSKGDTVELHVTLQGGAIVHSTTMSIQVELVYPDGTSVVIFPSSPVSLTVWTDIKLTEYSIKQSDPDGDYALVVSIKDPVTGKSDQGRISFTVKSNPIYLEIIVAVIIVAGVSVGVILIRRRRKEMAKTSEHA